MAREMTLVTPEGIRTQKRAVSEQLVGEGSSFEPPGSEMIVMPSLECWSCVVLDFQCSSTPSLQLLFSQVEVTVQVQDIGSAFGSGHR